MSTPHQPAPRREWAAQHKHTPYGPSSLPVVVVASSLSNHYIVGRILSQQCFHRSGVQSPTKPEATGLVEPMPWSSYVWELECSFPRHRIADHLVIRDKIPVREGREVEPSNFVVSLTVLRMMNCSCAFVLQSLLRI
jgi:hypothetical protein